MAGSIPSHINSVAIPIVENQTAEFGMSESVTENLLTKFNEENILRVTDETIATSVLNGTIMRVTDAPYTFTQQEAVTEYRFTVHMKIEWIDLINDEILIQKNFSGWGAYGLSGDISSDGIDNDNDSFVDEKDDDEFGLPRESAIKIAARQVTETITNNIISTW